MAKMWNDLTLSEKSEMMRIAVQNGITTLPEIKEAYNSFAEGGPTEDEELINLVIKEEGFNKVPEDIGDGKTTLGSGLTDPKWHAIYKQKGVWTKEDNRKAVAEELAKRRAILRDTFPNWDSLSKDSQNALLSYKYNYNFTESNSPKMYAAARAGDWDEVAKQIDATSKNPKFKKGLMQRRLREQALFKQGVDLANNFQLSKEHDVPQEVAVPDNTRVFTPYVQAEPMPVMVPDEGRYVSVHYDAPETRVTKKVLSALDAIALWNKIQKEWDWQNRQEEQYPFPMKYGIGNI